MAVDEAELFGGRYRAGRTGRSHDAQGCACHLDVRPTMGKLVGRPGCRWVVWSSPVTGESVCGFWSI